ncbi:MAG: hypothetical protein WBC44_02765 [Planctomycetaceae bacterium]
MFDKNDSLASRFMRRGSLLLFALSVGSLCPHAAAEEYDAHTPITDVVMQNPTEDEVWLIDSPHTLTCSTSTDTDRKRPSEEDPWEDVGDSVTHFWSATGGQFKNNDNVGTSVEYICSHVADFYGITVYADDDYAPDNDPVVDEDAKSDSETIQVVGLEVFSVGFTADHSLKKTPTPDPWADGAAAITDPIWILGGTDNAATNHVCWTKGEGGDTATVKARVSKALTEEASFQLGGTGTGTWNWGNCSIGSGSTESSEATCTHVQDWIDKVSKGGLTCNWQFKYPTGANVQRSLNSSSHSVYLTYGTPAGSDVTVKRIDFVCGAANGLSGLGECADAVFGQLNGSFDLESENWGPDPVWLLHNPPGTETSQCPGLAFFVSKHFEMLGLGAGEIRYCHATAAGGYAAPLNFTVPTRTIGAEHPAGTAHNDHSLEEEIGHVDGNGGINNFEATCFFNGKHYALGVGAFSTAKEVVKTAFTVGGVLQIYWFYSDASGWEKCTEAPWVEAP